MTFVLIVYFLAISRDVIQGNPFGLVTFDFVVSSLFTLSKSYLRCFLIAYISSIDNYLKQNIIGIALSIMKIDKSMSRQEWRMENN